MKLVCHVDEREMRAAFAVYPRPLGLRMNLEPPHTLGGWGAKPKIPSSEASAGTRRHWAGGIERLFERLFRQMRHIPLDIQRKYFEPN